MDIGVKTEQTYVVGPNPWCLPMPEGLGEDHVTIEDLNQLVQGPRVNQFDDTQVTHHSFSGTIRPQESISDSQGAEFSQQPLWSSPSSLFEVLIEPPVVWTRNGWELILVSDSEIYAYAYHYSAPVQSNQCYLYREYSSTQCQPGVWMACDVTITNYPYRSNPGTNTIIYDAYFYRLYIQQNGSVAYYRRRCRATIYSSSISGLVREWRDVLRNDFESFMQLCTEGSFPVATSNPSRYTGFSISRKAPSKDDIARLRLAASAMVNDLYTTVIPHWQKTASNTQLSEMSQDLADACKEVDVNLISFLPEIFSSVPDIKNWLMTISQHRAKDVPGLYLSYLYGPRLTVEDANKLSSGCEATAKQVRQLKTRAAYAHRSSQHSTGSIHYDVDIRRKLYYDPVDRGLRAVCEKNISYSLFTAENAWDLCPFSFIVDWVWDVSAMCEAYDSATLLQLLDIKAVLGSEKFVFTRTFAFPSGLEVNLTLSSYIRGKRRLTLPTFPDTSRSDVSKHIPELTCIIATMAQ